MSYELDPEIEALLPARTDEEKSLLRAVIGQSLHIDPLVILTFPPGGTNGESGTLLRILGDGHGRREIAQELGLACPERDLGFTSRAEAVQWIIDNQLGRRNLTPRQRQYYMGKEYLHKKKPVGRPSKKSDAGPPEQCANSEHNGTEVGSCQLVVGSEDGSTAVAVAGKHGVSEATVRRNAEFAEALDQMPVEEKAAILSGETKVTVQEIIKPMAPGTRAPVGATPAGDATDSFGNLVPRHRRDAWGDTWLCETFDALTVLEERFRLLRLADGLSKREKVYPFYKVKDVVDGCGFVMKYLDDLIKHLRDFRPGAVCPDCHGEGCVTCILSGLVPRSFYLQLIEDREAASVVEETPVATGAAAPPRHAFGSLFSEE